MKFRRKFRRRLVLGLALAAFATPAAQASTGYFVDGGAPPVSIAGTASTQVRSENSQTAATITPLQADALRWQAMADAYKQSQVGVAMSERSFGVPGPDPSLVPQVVATSTSSGFDWADAGIGASTGLVAALLLLAGVLYIRRNQHTGLTSA
jgi:hypothetical protein